MSGIAAALLIASAAAIAPTMLRPAGVVTWVMRALSVLGFIAWLPLVAIFAARTAPLRSTVAEVSAGLIVVATVAAGSFYVAGFLYLSSFSWRWAATVALQLISAAMVVLFALATRQEAILLRRGGTL